MVTLLYYCHIIVILLLYYCYIIVFNNKSYLQEKFRLTFQSHFDGEHGIYVAFQSNVFLLFLNIEPNIFC